MRAIIYVIILVLFVQSVTAAPWVINSTDKFIEKNGVKTFMVGSGKMCYKTEASYDENGFPYESCTDTISHNRNLDFIFVENFPSYLNDSGLYDFDQQLNNAGISWFGTTGSASSTGSAHTTYDLWHNMTNFAGWSHIDEPDIHTTDWNVTKSTSYYTHAKDINNTYTVYLNLGPNTKITTWAGAADIISWDTYANQTYSGTMNRSEWPYKWEYEAEYYQLNGINNAETYSKPIIGIINTYNQTAGVIGAASLADIRLQSYQSVIFGLKGIAYFPNKEQQTLPGVPWSPYGYYANPTTYTYINQTLAAELHSFDWLFLNSTAKSRKQSGTSSSSFDFTSVNFTNNTWKTFHQTRNGYKFGYMLKHKNSTTDYLIALNKDINATTSTITISSLAGTGTRNATLIGLQLTGSGAYTNDPITVTNGTFSDTFDGYAAHVYEISTATTTPESPDEASANFTVCASGCNGTWSLNSSGENTTEDLGSHGIKPGLFHDSFNDNTEDWTESGGTGSAQNGNYWFNASGGSFLSSNGNVSWTNYSLYADVNLGVNSGSGTTYAGLRVRKNPNGSIGYTMDYDNHKVFTQSGGDVTGLSIPQYNVTLNLSQTYKLKLRIFGTNLSEWFDSIWLGSDDNYASANNVSGNISLLIRYGNASYDNVYVLTLDASGNEIITGNHTISYDAGIGNETYKVIVNVTTPANTNYSVYYRSTGTGSPVLINSSQTGNTTQTIPTNAEYQNTEILVQLNGNETALPELLKVSFYTQASTETETTSYHDETFLIAGNYTITVNATNANGTSNTITWYVNVSNPSASTEWTTGINGVNFDDIQYSGNNICINGGDGSIQVRVVCSNFNDNNYNEWSKTGNASSQWSAYLGAMNQSSAYPGYLYQNVSSYENMRGYAKFKTNNASNFIDAVDLRGNLSRSGTNIFQQFYQFSIGAGVDRAMIAAYNGSSWITVSNASAGLSLNTWTYSVFDVYGTTAKAYLGTSYVDALNNLKGSNTSTSIWLNGTTVQFGGVVLGSGIITWDEVSFASLDSLGNVNTSGNFTTMYDAGSNYIKNLTIASNITANTNYSILYREANTGDYILVGGLRTSELEVVELPTPYFQSIDILLEMNASQSDTLSINTITVETTDSNGSVNIYNTGYQYVLVNNTLTNTQLNGIWSPTWIIHWNSTSQKWENYKSGWSIRSSHSINKGDAVGIKVTTNNSILLTTNTSYNWTLSTGQNLVGLEFTKTLSQINTSVNTACEVNLIEYIEPETQTSYLYTCGQANNASIEVKVGEGIWMNSTASKDIVRTW